MTLLSNYFISGTCLFEPTPQCVQDSVSILEDFGGVPGLLREPCRPGNAGVGSFTEDAGHLSDFYEVWKVHLLCHQDQRVRIYPRRRGCRKRIFLHLPPHSRSEVLAVIRGELCPGVHRGILRGQGLRRSGLQPRHLQPPPQDGC